MAAIDRNALLEDIKFWLPEGNVLSDANILKIAEYVIADVGDDDSKYAEVLCKSLKACGQANLTKHTVDTAALKQERVGEHSETYDPSIMKNTWNNFLDSLADICPIFGYRPTKSVGIGMKISPSVKPTINDCCSSVEDLYL